MENTKTEAIDCTPRNIHEVKVVELKQLLLNIKLDLTRKAKMDVLNGVDEVYTPALHPELWEMLAKATQ